MSEINGHSNEGVGEVLTIEEMERRFDREWILIGDPETGELNEIVSGRIMARSRSRDDIDRALLSTPQGRRYAVLFLGDIPDESAVIL